MFSTTSKFINITRATTILPRTQLTQFTPYTPQQFKWLSLHPKGESLVEKRIQEAILNS